jgi:hypothetical protein
MESRTSASAPTPKLPNLTSVLVSATPSPATASNSPWSVEKFLRQGIPLAIQPKRLRELVLRSLLRESVLAQGIQQARSTFMSGMHTYLLKLGPEMLGSAYTKLIDRQIAAALPSFCVRLRLQDTAQLLADTLLPLLRSNPNLPLRLINIADGPAMDSLNALILLTQQTGILEQRPVSIDVLDLDDSGPAFGAAALAALSQPGGPLHGLRITLRHVPYDWTQAEELPQLLNEAHATDQLTICSSEAGLFEYGSDEEIDSNLKVLRAQPQLVAVAGSVTRADEPVQQLRKTTTAKTRPRGLPVFAALADRARWKITPAIERPFSDQVVLT